MIFQNTERTDCKVSEEEPVFTLLYAEMNPLQVICRERKYMRCLQKVTIPEHWDPESVFVIIQVFFS